MHRALVRALLLLAVVAALSGCAGTGTPWTFAPGQAGIHQAAAQVTLAPAASGMPATSTASAAPSTAPSEMPGMSIPSTAPAADQPPVPPEEFNPIVPPLLPGTAHDIDLPIEDRIIEVAPGRTVAAWTFGGTVPGPVIHVTVGDTVRVHLTNDTPMSHSIDFHASQTAMNDQMVEIKPGATWTYTFTADYAGVWMYHCGTAPALLHIANGMFGMVIAEPKGGLPKVDQQLGIVQSEWYLGQDGQPSDYTKASAANPAPDYVVFNGVANQYRDHPIQVEPGQRLRFFVLDAGPNEPSSFHIVGTIFDRVISEGVIMDASTNGGWASQAVDLAPAQAAIIELTIPESGMYTMVTHAFNFVGLGAVGQLMAGDGKPPTH